ncbi:MAG: hypothetical protein AB6733_19145 [Clostridiaceae bacterium]
MEKNNKEINKVKGTSKFVIFVNTVLVIAALSLFASSYFISGFSFTMKIILNLVGEGIIALVFFTTGMRFWVKRGDYFQGILLILGSIVIVILGVFTFMNVFK